jgi:hypothetical protein
MERWSSASCSPPAGAARSLRVGGAEAASPSGMRSKRAAASPDGGRLQVPATNEDELRLRPAAEPRPQATTSTSSRQCVQEPSLLTFSILFV